MRIFEIILKLAFLVGAIWILVVNDITSTCVLGFLVVCLLLGIVLIFNKKASYKYPQSKRDYMISRVEGIILVAFAGVSFYVLATSVFGVARILG